MSVEENIYVFAAISGDFGKWAYCLNNEIKYGDSKGTTKDQMYLMAILQVLRSDNVGEKILIHIPEERTYKRIIGVYEKKTGIITSYLNDIEWATGSIKITYVYTPEKELANLSFYMAIQRIFQGRQ